MKYILLLFITISFAQTKKNIDGKYLAINNDVIYGIKINTNLNEINFYYHKKDTDTIQNWKKFITKNISWNSSKTKYYVVEKVFSNKNNNPNQALIESSNEAQAKMLFFNNQNSIEMSCNEIIRDFRNRYDCKTEIIQFQRIE